MDVRMDAEICAVGDLASQFFEEGIVILFGEHAPEELAEFAVLHRCLSAEGGVTPGDRVLLGDAELTVTGVGSVVNEHLPALGHLVLKRDGRTEPQLPGDLCCDEGAIPDLAAGMPLRILGPEQG
ncbi:MAG: PTS glucitol/sorbitol transporter subunit IIA [Egibacteraceae bacterium]